MTQQIKILKLGIKAGTTGINSFGEARRIALQLPRVMDDLKDLGVIWRSIKNADRSVNYVFLHVPEGLLATLEKQAKAVSVPQSPINESNVEFRGNTAYQIEPTEQKSMFNS